MVLAATNTKGWAKRNFLTYRNELGCVQPKKKLITKLPGWFPDSPTPDDIRRLGEQWGPDAAVAVGITIPMPDLSSCVPATLPTGYLIDVLSQDPITSEWAGGVVGSGKATWRFEGGSGLMYSSLSHIGHPVEDNNAQDAPPDYLSVTYYPALNSEAPLVVTTTSSINIGNRYNSSSEDQTWDVTWDWSAGVVPDCGQANIPQSLIRMWNIPRIAWTDKNRPAPDEYYARTYAGLGPRDVRASPTWPAKHWISEPGTDNN